MLENPIGGAPQKVETNVQKNVAPKPEQNSTRRVAKPKFESDGEVVDPSQFFS